jgi:hypothetical protein
MVATARSCGESSGGSIGGGGGGGRKAKNHCGQRSSIGQGPSKGRGQWPSRAKRHRLHGTIYIDRILKVYTATYKNIQEHTV